MIVKDAKTLNNYSLTNYKKKQRIFIFSVNENVNAKMFFAKTAIFILK